MTDESLLTSAAIEKPDIALHLESGERAQLCRSPTWYRA